MKKYSILLSAALSVLALASCQKEQKIDTINNPSDASYSIPFILRAETKDVNADAVNPANVPSKTSLNTSTWEVSWDDDDIIYGVTTDEEWGVAYASDKPGATIADFAYDPGTGTFSTDLAISDGSHTFNFLYSGNAQRSYHRGASTTFSLAGTQTFDASDPTAHLKSYDALAAQVPATTPTAFADIEMSHLFSLMKVTLKNKTGEAVNMSKFEIEIPGQNLYGIFNVTFGATPTASYSENGGDKITVNISNGTVANNGSLDVYFVVGPVTAYTGEVTFKVTDDADNTYTKTNTISGPGVTFAAGTYNTANYTIKSIDPPTITSWVETAIGSLAANDVVAIVDKASSRAMTNDKGGSNPPLASSVTISGSNITSVVADNMQWVFESPSTGSYSFKVPGSSNYLYTTDDNNGVRVGTNANKVFNFVENADNSTYYLKNSTTNRYLGVYTTNYDWRSYKTVNSNILDTRTAFYKKTSVAASAYSIAITSPSNGTVVTSPASTAYEGSTVTITATPNSGYVLTSVTVNAGAVAVTPVDDTHYTFTMPSADVTIAATFTQTFTITPSATNGSVEVSPSTTSVAGETITITATPNPGYAFSSWTVTGATPADASANPTTFTMPSGNVTVTANFVSAKTITRLIASIDDVSAAGEDSGELDDAYSLTNATDSDITTTCDGTVVTTAVAGSGSILYEVAANTGAARYGWIRIAVAGGNTIEITVNQLAGETKYTITWNSTNNSKGVSSYSNSWTVTASGITCNMTNWNNNNNLWSYVKCGHKTTAYTATIITAAIPEAIKTVTLSIGAVTTQQVTSAKLFVSDSSSFGDTPEGSFELETGEQSVVIGSPAANKYYKIEVACTTGSNNGPFQLNQLVFTTK